LKNIRQRLASVYGDTARIRCEKTPEQFIVELSIPLEFENTQQ